MSLIYSGPVQTQEQKARCYEYYKALSDADLRAAKKEFRALLQSDRHLSMAELDEIAAKLDQLEAVIEAREERESRNGLVRFLNGGTNPFGPGGRLRYAGSPGAGGPRVIETFNPQEITRSGEKMEKVEVRATPEYRTAFLNYAMGRPLAPEERALLVTLSSGAVIPTQTFNEVIQNIRKAQGLISLVRVLDIPGKLSIPQSDINTPAVWHAEGEEIADSNKPPASVTLTGYELAKLFSMSAATQAMSMDAFEGYLIEELTRCTRDALADVIFNGTGSGQPTGILNAFTWDQTNSVTYSVASDDWSKLASAMALLPANFRQNAVFTMNSTMFYSFIVPMKDTTKAPIFAQDLASGLPASLLGKPVVIDDFCPDDTIIFGDPGYYFLNFSQPITVERSGDAGFTKAVVMYRALAVVDGKPVAPAFVKITKAA